jgi:hypothetical protein
MLYTKPNMLHHKFVTHNKSHLAGLDGRFSLLPNQINITNEIIKKSQKNHQNIFFYPKTGLVLEFILAQENMEHFFSNKITPPL